MATVTTTLALVGPRATAVAAAVSLANGNVSMSPAPEDHDDDLDWHEGLTRSWQAALGRPPVYTLFPADPLGAVVDAWQARLSGNEHELETLIRSTPALQAPHYYVIDPAVAEPQVHWYHGLVAGRAADRVLLCPVQPAPIADLLGDLPTGRELPSLDVLAGLAREFVPVGRLSLPS